MEQAPEQLSPIVGGLTKPPMMLGVPLALFMVEAVIGLLVFVLVKNLWSIPSVLPIHAIAYYLTVRDLRFVDVFRVYVSKALPVPNYRYWGGNSYSP